MDQLVIEYQSRNILEPGTRSEYPMNLKQWEREISRRTGLHFAGVMRRFEDTNTVNVERTKWGGTKTQNFDRKLCLLCKRNVPTYCKTCEVTLCIR